MIYTTCVVILTTFIVPNLGTIVPNTGTHLTQHKTQGDAMTFAQAEKRLAELANGDYHAIRFERTTFGERHHGKQANECTVYVNNYGHHKGSTWEMAFASLENAIAEGNSPDPKDNI